MAKGREPARLSTGIVGLDELLGGGLLPGRSYMVRGEPGTGKTTMGLHFVSAGACNGEKALLITFGESEGNLRLDATSIGVDLAGLTVLDLTPTSASFANGNGYGVFSADEVEREPLTSRITECISRLKPERVLIDAITYLRFLCADEHQFRKQTLSFLRYLAEQGATVVLTSEATPACPDDDLQFMVDGVICLTKSTVGRGITVGKARGLAVQTGCHTMELTGHGMVVFPRLVPTLHPREFALEIVSSGIPDLDQQLHGGLERGTVTIITGPSGVGKTTLGLQFMKEAAGRGERSVVYSFEEDPSMLVARSEAIKMPVRSLLDHGTLDVQRIEPLRYSADEFAGIVREEVEEKGARAIMIDSTAGYRLAVRGEDPVWHLHRLCKYLTSMNVTVLVVNEVEWITGEFRATELGISYMADSIVFMRYLEMRGEIRKVIGVLKKRLGSFERFVREFQITAQGVKVGRPLRNVRGILTGTPEFIDQPPCHTVTDADA